MKKKVSIALLVAGIFLLLQVIVPYTLFKIEDQNSLISPQTLGVSIKDRSANPQYSEFFITVDSINLKNEKVYVDSNDLNRGLAHLPGSALPGEKGNVFISGHSALPSFFVFYKSAPFANLTKVKIGDIVEVLVGETKFRYQISEIKTVDPKDLSVISPRDSVGRYISLMTCVPPGINIKRLVVIGSLI